MSNRQMIMLVLIFAVVLVGTGVASFWLGARHGSKQTREDLQLANGLLLGPQVAMMSLPEPADRQPERQIGFHRGAGA